jgi:hypothetical protein
MDNTNQSNASETEGKPFHPFTPANISGGLGNCWFCGRATDEICKCGRAYCEDHGFYTHCMVCALGYGMFDHMRVKEPVSDAIMYSFASHAGDPYIVIPAKLQTQNPLPLRGAERLVGAMLLMMQSDDKEVRHRAAVVLATTTNSWPTMNPSPLDEHQHSISLLTIDQVRKQLLDTLKASRGMNYELTALAILEKLRSADFRDLYPGIQNNLRSLTCGTLGARVREVFDALTEFYPTHRPMVNERCEILVYEQYARQDRGPGELMKRIYGPLMRYSPTLQPMLRKGTWLSNRAKFKDWYYGEDEPFE